MKFDHYYSEIFKEDGSINNEYITYLSCIHIINSITNRDKVTNKPLTDLGSKYAERFYEATKDIKSPLTFVRDDLYDLYLFTLPHLKAVLRNPHNQIVKEKQLIDKSKLKNIDNKALIWLSPKSGMNIREKLSNVDKVLSPVKRFTNDVKENQVLVSYFKSIRKYLLEKIKTYKDHPEIYGENGYEEVDNLNHQLGQINLIIKEDFDEVRSVYHTTPNNALIGNVNYHALWKSYLSVRNTEINYINVFEEYKRIFFISFVLTLMNSYDFIEKYESIDDISEYILYKTKNNELEEITFEDNENIVISTYDISGLKSVKKDEKAFKIELKQSENESNGGISYSLFIDDKKLSEHTADLKGLKESIKKIADHLKLSIETKGKINVDKAEVNFISINSYDNTIYGNEINQNPLILNDNNGTFKPNRVYEYLGNTLTLNKKDDAGYYNLLKEISDRCDFSKNSVLIYDVRDDYDQFSSSKLRQTFTSNYPRSYPVWRSILAAESFGNSKLNKVVDITDDEMSLTNIGYKNGRYVHKGSEPIPIYIDGINEKMFYEELLSKYEEKYCLLPNEVKNELISTGKLEQMIINKANTILLYENDYYHMFYDEDIVKEEIDAFDNKITGIIAEFDSNTLFIVPNFIEKNDRNIVLNNELIKGANTIIGHVNKNETPWYEYLPELSLEVIRNGVFDTLKIVESKECENIIGKDYSFNINETFTLAKGEKNYSLPLNKSFVGSKNKNYNASLKDSSFPLNEDVEVKLRIIYNLEKENTYDLIFEPIKKDAPFKKIEADWVEAEESTNIINPNIKDVVYDENSFAKIKEKITNNLANLDYSYSRVLRAKGQFEAIKELMRTFRYLANDIQRIKHSRFEKESEAFMKQINTTENSGKIKRYIKMLVDIASKREFPSFIDASNISTAEQVLYELTSSKDLFIKNQLVYPQLVLGRGLADLYKDNDFMNYAANMICDFIRISDDHSKFNKCSDFLERITAGTAVDHNLLFNCAESNFMLVKYLIKLIIVNLKYMADYKWAYSKEERGINSRDCTYNFKSCMELLISLLYCRDLPLFEDFRPGKNEANEIIFYIKKLNKKLMKCLKYVPEDKAEKVLRTKYKMEIKIPDELKNMHKLCYCLILYLSGDARANLIKVTTE